MTPFGEVERIDVTLSCEEGGESSGIEMFTSFISVPGAQQWINKVAKEFTLGEIRIEVMFVGGGEIVFDEPGDPPPDIASLIDNYDPTPSERTGG